METTNYPFPMPPALLSAWENIKDCLNPDEQEATIELNKKGDMVKLIVLGKEVIGASVHRPTNEVHLVYGKEMAERPEYLLNAIREFGAIFFHAKNVG